MANAYTNFLKFGVLGVIAFVGPRLFINSEKQLAILDKSPENSSPPAASSALPLTNPSPSRPFQNTRTAANSSTSNPYSVSNSPSAYGTSSIPIRSNSNSSFSATTQKSTKGQGTVSFWQSLKPVVTIPEPSEYDPLHSGSTTAKSVPKSSLEPDPGIVSGIANPFYGQTHSTRTAPTSPSQASSRTFLTNTTPLPAAPSGSTDLPSLSARSVKTTDIPDPRLDVSNVWTGPLTPLENTIRFDRYPAWITETWPRVDSAGDDPLLKGYRVSVVTGLDNDDLTGVLTYYFDQYRLQRITFAGQTGDFRKTLLFLRERFGMAFQNTSSGSRYVYESYYPGQSGRTNVNYLWISPARTFVRGQERESFEISFKLERPKG